MHTYAGGQDENSSLGYCYVVRNEKLKQAEMKTSIQSSDSLKKEVWRSAREICKWILGLKGFN